MGSVRDWAVNWFEKSRTGHHEGGRTTLRVIELRSVYGPSTPLNRYPWGLCLGSVTVEEHEVLGSGHGSNGT